MAEKRLDQLDETTTPDDASLLWVYDDTNVIKDRKWGLLSFVAWIKTKLSTVANTGTHSDLVLDDGTNPHGTTKTDVGLANVDNTADIDKPISTAQQTAIDGKIDSTEKGSANGVATLDGSGLVPSGQLPSYVDDVLEYADFASFPATGETGKVYIDLSTNTTYRWSGTVYVKLSEDTAVWGQISGTLADQTDLGTAASSDTQTSLDDSTADRLLKVGAFGLGGASKTYTDSDNINSITQFGLSIAYVSGWAGTFGSPITQPGTLYTYINGSYYGSQIFVETSGDKKMYYRSFVAGAWESWKELLDSGNYPSDTAWTVTTFEAGWLGVSHYIKRTGMVTVSVNYADGSSATSDDILILPAEYRPANDISIAAYTTTGTALVTISSSTGAVSTASRDTNISFLATFPVL